MNRLTIIRDVLHESSYNQCRTSDDECQTWEPARELCHILDHPDMSQFGYWHQKWFSPLQSSCKRSVRENIKRKALLWWRH